MAKKATQRKSRKAVTKVASRAKPKPRKKTMTTNHKHADVKEAPRAEARSVPPEEMLTEQEKDVYANSGNGVGPMPASAEPLPIETMEDQGIGPRDPYPTGDSPPAAESTTRSQGIKGVTDKPSESPSESKGPVGTTRKDDKK